MLLHRLYNFPLSLSHCRLPISDAWLAVLITSIVQMRARDIEQPCFNMRVL